MTLKWNGPKQFKRIQQALKEAIDETTEAIADSAEARVRRRTGDLSRSIGTAAAEVQGEDVVGAVGAGEFYGLFEEIQRPYLRPAADSEVPRLAGRVKDRLK